LTKDFNNRDPNFLTNRQGKGNSSHKRCDFILSSGSSDESSLEEIPRKYQNINANIEFLPKSLQRFSSLICGSQFKTIKSSYFTSTQNDKTTKSHLQD
jgi:hypothetical protein